MSIPRYATMSVPGRREDGSDTAWFVRDRRTRTSTSMGDGAAGLRRAGQALRRLNDRNRRDRRPKNQRHLPRDDE
jgi:hypothetical protein